MNLFSVVSSGNLEQCHPYLQEVAIRVLEIINIAVDCGHRPQVDQEKAVREGKSKVHYPHSAHNSCPSLAFDLRPWLPQLGVNIYNTFDPKVAAIWGQLAGVVIAVGNEVAKTRAEWKRFSIIWGSDWNGDRNVLDTNFLDYGHFEVKIGGAHGNG